MSLSQEAKRLAEFAKLGENAQIKQLRKLEAQVVELKNRCRDGELRRSSAEQELEELQVRVETMISLEGRKPVKLPTRPKRIKGNEATALLVLSDWHIEETVESAKVNGLNEFNLKIAKLSIQQTFEKSLLLLEDARHLTNCREMVVAVLGDLISGYIHDELVESNSLAPLPASMLAGDCLETGLRMLLEYGELERIIVPTCRGNHGRTTQRSRCSTGAENSFEHNLYLHLQRRFADEPRIVWQIGSGYHNWLNIQGYDVRFHHGDAINYWGGVGGITIPVNKAIAQWNKSRHAHYDIFGHFHQWLWNWNWVCNGSLIGYGPFSLQIKADYQPPLQTFAVIDRDRGMTRVLPLFCR